MSILKQLLQIRLTIILLLLLFGINLFAQNTVKITVNAASDKIAISPYIYGKNNNLSDWIGKPISQTEWQRLRNLGITMFRECGGNNSTKYNWRRKLSSHPDWYNNVYSHDWNYSATSLQQNIPEAQGMWAFQLIGKVAKTNQANFGDWNYNSSQWWSGVHQNLCGGGIINPAGGSDALQDGNPDLYLEDWPADSTVGILDHWFKAENLGLDSTKIQYWGMDNEPEIWNGTHDDVMPEQISAEEFMQIYFDVAKKARAKFPGIKLCGPVPANEWQWYNWKNGVINYNGKNYVWLEYFIKRVAEEQNATGIRLLDVLDIHFYPGENNPEDIVQLHRVYFDKSFIYSGANGVKRINGGWDNNQKKEYILARCEDWLTKYLGTNHGVAFGVSETGINSDDPNVCANWYASTLGEFAKQKVEFFTPWSWKKGMYEVIHLFSKLGQNFFVEGISDNEEFVSAYPTINKNSDSITLFLINRNLTETKELEIDIQNFITKDEPLQMLTLSNLPGNETFVNHTNNAIKISEIDKPGFNLKVELEPLSVNAIILKAAPSKNSTLKENLFSSKFFPNPVSSQLNLVFSLSEKSWVRINLLGLNGQLISTILDREFNTGTKNISTNVSEIPSGIYFLNMSANHFSKTQKIVINHN